MMRAPILATALAALAPSPASAEPIKISAHNFMFAPASMTVRMIGTIVVQ